MPSAEGNAYSAMIVVKFIRLFDQNPECSWDVVRETVDDVAKQP